MPETTVQSIETIENLIFLGNLSQAGEILDPLFINHPDEPEWYRLKLMILYEKYRQQEVEKMVLTICHKFPDTAESALAFALTPGITALQCTRRINKAIRRSPADAYLFYLRGRNAIHQDSYVYALADLNICLELNANITKAYLLRSDCLSHLGMHQYAFRDLVTYWNREPLQNEDALMVRMLCVLTNCLFASEHSFGSLVITPEGVDVAKILHEAKIWKFILHQPLPVLVKPEAS